jgi:hypothetical protein
VTLLIGCCRYATFPIDTGKYEHEGQAIAPRCGSPMVTSRPQSHEALGAPCRGARIIAALPLLEFRASTTF